MFKNISLGIYYPGKSFLHHLQARTKLLVFLCISICLFVANGRVWHFAPYVVIVLLTLLSARLGDIPLSHLWRRLRLLLFLCLIGAIPTVLFPDGIGRPLYAFGPFYPTYG